MISAYFINPDVVSVNETFKDPKLALGQPVTYIDTGNPPKINPSAGITSNGCGV